MSRVTLHHAPWIMPVASPVVENGAVAVSGGRILAAGSQFDLGKQFAGMPVREHPGCVLMPGLVNAHIHLELSHLPIAAEKESPAGFTQWIGVLLGERERRGSCGPAVEDAARSVLLDQHRGGVAAMGDIGNTDVGARLAADFPGILLHFEEFLGRSRQSRKKAAAGLAAAPDDKLFTAHAPYSTHPELLLLVKERARRLSHPFPIHTAEPDSESELLSSGSGELHDFLAGRGFLDDSFRPPAAFDKPGSVLYLHRLGILDSRTICVHCIHVSQEEVQLLAAAKTKVCLCPGSNRYLRAGTAPLPMFLEAGILPAIGTDSPASNPRLSLWREMRCLHEDHPTVDPAVILTMATMGGATALGLDKDLGSLAAGKSSSFIAVPLPEHIKSPAELAEHLVSDGACKNPAWTSED